MITERDKGPAIIDSDFWSRMRVMIVGSQRVKSGQEAASSRLPGNAVFFSAVAVIAVTVVVVEISVAAMDPCRSYFQLHDSTTLDGGRVGGTSNIARIVCHGRGPNHVCPSLEPVFHSDWR